MTQDFQLTLSALAVGYAVAISITPFTSRLARRFNIMDHPAVDSAGYKKHSSSIPYLGGVAIFLGTALGSLFLLVASEDETSANVGRWGIVVAVGIGLALIGMLDDMQHLPRSVRAGAQIGAAIGAWAAGFQINITPFMWLNLLIMVVWTVGITNAFNLLDNMDGLSAGLAGVAAITFAAMGVVEGLPALGIVAAALGGSVLGFLVHNRHPARAFMGDAGSLFIGFLLAVVGIKLQFENLVSVTFLVPVVVLGLPIFDTTLVVISRMRHKRAVFLGGRDHVSHRLVQVGIPVRTSVGFLYFSGICLGWLGLAIARANPQVGFMLLGFVLAVGAFFGLLLFRVPVYAEEAAEVAALEEEQEEAKITYLETKG